MEGTYTLEDRGQRVSQGEAYLAVISDDWWKRHTHPEDREV